MNEHTFAERLEACMSSLRQELHRLRTARASAELVEDIPVEAYGSTMTVKQLASISVPEPRLIVLQPWDKSVIPAIEKAVRSGGMNLNPAVDGAMIRIPIPSLTEESRKQLVKLAHDMGEGGRVAVRRVRQDALEELDAQEESKEISEDEKFRKRDMVQKMVDEYNGKIEELLEQKEREIMTP